MNAIRPGSIVKCKSEFIDYYRLWDQKFIFVHEIPNLKNHGLFFELCCGETKSNGSIFKIYIFEELSEKEI